MLVCADMCTAQVTVAISFDTFRSDIANNYGYLYIAQRNFKILCVLPLYNWQHLINSTCHTLYQSQTHLSSVFKAPNPETKIIHPAPASKTSGVVQTNAYIGNCTCSIETHKHRLDCMDNLFNYNQIFHSDTVSNI